MRATKARLLLLSGSLLIAVIVLAMAFYLANPGRFSTKLVEVVSVLGPVPPYTPAGPTVSITLKNIGMIPIAKLTATLDIPRAGPASEPFTFQFNVAPSNPLLPNQSITKASILIGGGFDSDHSYQLIVSGTLTDGTPFAYTFSVRISTP